MRREVVAIGLLWLAGCAFEDLAVFGPVQTDAYRPVDGIPDAEFTTIDCDDAVSAVYVAPPEPPRGHVLLLHGSYAQLDDTHPWLRTLRNWGYEVLAIDYRGYGTSPGDPTEAGLYADADCALAHAQQARGFDPSTTIIWGHSLGGAVASHIASTRDAALLVLESTFTSIEDMVGATSPYGVPRSWATEGRFDTVGRLPDISAPVLILHGDRDDRVPAWMAEENFARATSAKQLVLVPTRDHNGALEEGQAEARDALRALDPDLAPP